MRKIILSLAVSFDGFIEGPNGEVDWITFTEESGKALNFFLKEIDTVLYGRVSYEKWGTYAPSTDSSAFEQQFYAALKGMNMYVFTSSSAQFEGNPTVVRSDINQVMDSLKQQPGKNIWLYGGTKLITTFMNLDLVDEFRIAVFPVILGDGKPLFKDLKRRTKLKLLDVNTGKSDVVQLTYARSHS